MEKSSLIYVRNVSASSANAQARELFNNQAPELGLGLATGTRLRARLESAASTAVRTPVLAVISITMSGTEKLSCLREPKRLGTSGTEIVQVTLTSSSILC